MEFVNFELAKKLKEKGFKEDCLCHYITNDIVYNLESPIANNQMWFCHNKYDNIWHRDNYDAPTISQVLKWLREEKTLHVYIEYVFSESSIWICEVQLIGSYERFYPPKDYETYEEAAIACIEYVLDNLI